MSTDNGTTILQMAAAAAAAAEAAAEEERRTQEAERRARVREDWRPVITTILAQVEHQTGAELLGAEEDATSAATYYHGAGWTLKQPDSSVTAYKTSSTEYKPALLYINNAPVPVACWSDGRDCSYRSAQIVLDRDDGDIWIGEESITAREIRNGNTDLLAAIHYAATKTEEYNTKQAQAQAIIEAEMAPAPEPAPDTLASAAATLERFAYGLEIMRIPADSEIDADDVLADERAMLIAGQIHALAQEVRRLTDTLEATR